MTPRRDRLADALACVTDRDVEHWEANVGAPDSGRRSALRVGADRVTIGAFLAWPLTITDPRETWEAVASSGLVPMDWLDEPGRRFVGVERTLYATLDAVPRLIDGALTMSFREQGVAPQIALERTVYRPHPPSVAACVLLAADAAGVLAAEAIVRSLGVLAARRPVVWRLVAADEFARAAIRSRCRGTGASVRAALDVRALGYAMDVEGGTWSGTLLCPDFG